MVFRVFLQGKIQTTMVFPNGMFRGSLWGTYPTIPKDPGDFTAGGGDILPIGI